MISLSERLEEYTRPFRIAAAAIGFSLVLWLFASFFARDDVHFTQWCGGRRVPIENRSIESIAQSESTAQNKLIKPFLIKFCNPHLMWENPETVRVPNRALTVFLVFAFLLMLFLAFITSQRWWGMYLFLFVLVIKKIFSGVGWSICFGNHAEATTTTAVTAFASQNNVPAMMLRACNLMFIRSTIPAGMDLTIPNMFGLVFALLLVIGAFLPPIWILFRSMLKWSGRRGQQMAGPRVYTLLIFALLSGVTAGCERGLDGDVPPPPIKTPVVGGATLVPPLAFPTRAPDRPTAELPKRTDKNTVTVDFDISTQNVCYPSMEESNAHRIEGATRIGNKLPDKSECHGSSTHTAATGETLSVMNFVRTGNDMGFVIMNKDLSTSPIFELDLYFAGKIYVIDLDGTIFSINRDPRSGDHVLTKIQDGTKPMATPIPLPEATVDPASLVNWSNVDPKTILNAAMKDICIDTYNQQKELSMGDLILWNDGSRLGIEDADDWGCVSIAISPDQRYVAFSYVCPTCADPDQQLMALKFDLRNIANGPEIIWRTLIAHIDSHGSFSPSGVTELPEFRRSGRSFPATTPTTGPK